MEILKERKPKKPAAPEVLSEAEEIRKFLTEIDERQRERDESLRKLLKGNEPEETGAVGFMRFWTRNQIQMGLIIALIGLILLGVGGIAGLMLAVPGIIIYWYAKAKREADLLTGVKTMDEILAEDKEYWDRRNWDSLNPENPSSPYYMDD